MSIGEQAQAAAEKSKADLLEEFPGIEEEMLLVAELVSPITGNLTMEEVIYKSLLTGAAIISARYRAAQSGEKDFLSRVMKKT